VGKKKRQRAATAVSENREAAASPAPAAEATPPQPKSAGDHAKEWIKALAIAFVIWFFLRALLVEAYHIPSGSMEDTLLEGDFLFVNKAVFGATFPIIHVRLPAFQEPERHDLVIFDSPIEHGLTVVKRIIGMPGDTIAMVGNTIYIDGVAQDEPFAKSTNPLSDPEVPEMRPWQLRYLVNRDGRTYRPTLKNWGPLVIPADSFFVMGDNRDNSLDSRYWGFLGRDRIEGQPLFIYYSFDKNGVLPLPFLTDIRWSRILSTPD
jgi:signal peptidase I